PQRPFCAPGPTPAQCATRPHSPCSPESPRCQPTAARSPPDTGSTDTATANSTAPCTPSPSHANAMTRPPRTTPPAEPPKARPPEKSNAASSDTSPATSTANSRTHPYPLDTP